MISHCPHCGQEINLSPAQQSKVETALAALQGGTLKMGCPHCSKPIELMSDGSLADWGQLQTKTPVEAGIAPPGPPDIGWLTSGDFEEQGELRDIPKALVAIAAGPVRTAVSGAFVESFYQPIAVANATEAIDQLRLVNYAAVVLHSEFEPGGLAKSAFHKVMCKMAMDKRRYIYYVLVGPKFNTLYGMQALANSANLVVNESDLKHLKTIMKRGKADYEELFGPLIETLRAHGRT
ncbi:MAG: hypothetical protein KKB30_07850 [Proteobacteria bacterium]|nr:hypothetical protein [Pseudomonadota bacterium]MBU1716030.1 hypothetical protein [Pseudomonadota bacterium]